MWQTERTLSHNSPACAAGMSSDLSTIPSAAGFKPGLRDHLCLQGAEPDACCGSLCGSGARLQPARAHLYTAAKQANGLRRAAIAKAHPEIEALCVARPDTALYVLGIVAAQIAVAAALESVHAPWWAVVGLAATLGAVPNQSLWTLIHELSHSAVFESPFWNLSYHLIANLPIVFPAAISFKYFHGLHHSHLNEAYGDPDLPGPIEHAVFGGSSLGKMLWLLVFFLWQSLRSLRYPANFGALVPWLVANWVVQLAFNAAVFIWLGPRALAYLTVASIFSIGLHPVGARWVAEHYAMRAPQETYSYYGTFNIFMFNIGYHNEHHDFPMAPWQALPAIKALAPEYYDSLWYHTSYWRLLTDFIFNPAFTLHSRLVRAPRGEAAPGGANYIGGAPDKTPAGAIAAEYLKKGSAASPVPVPALAARARSRSQASRRSKRS